MITKKVSPKNRCCADSRGALDADRLLDLAERLHGGLLQRSILALREAGQHLDRLLGPQTAQGLAGLEFQVVRFLALEDRPESFLLSAVVEDLEEEVHGQLVT